MNDLYDFFSGALKRLILTNPKHIVVAVSGGSDSMACASLAQKWGSENDVKISAIIVDHNLRPESSYEAITVQKRLKKICVNSIVLTNKEVAPDNGIQEFARNIRYKLIGDWCNENDVEYVLLGHHRGDVLETVALRMEMGSKTMGLTAMNGKRLTDWGTIIRPLLTIEKSDLVGWCKINDIDVVKDPSNNNEFFSRVRLRNKISKNSEFKRLLEVNYTNAIVRRRDIELKLISNIKKLATPYIGGAVKLDMSSLSLGYSELYYLIRHILMWVNGDFIPPRTEKLIRLVDSLLDDFPGATLHYCNVKILRNNLWIFREESKCSNAINLTGNKKEYVYDDRFYINNLSAGLKFANLKFGHLGGKTAKMLKDNKDSDFDFISLNDVPNMILNTFPALYSGDKLISIGSITLKNSYNMAICDNKWKLFTPTPFIY